MPPVVASDGSSVWCVVLTLCTVPHKQTNWSSRWTSATATCGVSKRAFFEVKAERQTMIACEETWGESALTTYVEPFSPEHTSVSGIEKCIFVALLFFFFTSHFVQVTTLRCPTQKKNKKTVVCLLKVHRSDCLVTKRWRGEEEGREGGSCSSAKFPGEKRCQPRAYGVDDFAIRTAPTRLVCRLASAASNLAPTSLSNFSRRRRPRSSHICKCWAITPLPLT